MKSKLSEKERKKIIELALKGVPVRKICRQYRISRVLFYKILRRYRKNGDNGLLPLKGGRPKKRKQFQAKPFRRLTTHERFRMVEEVLDEGKSPSEIAAKYHISRVTLYKWIKRYKSNRELRIHAVKDKTPELERYHNQAPELYEKAVLSLVAKHPEFGVRRLVKNLPKIGSTPILGHHGVQNVLRRHDLSTFEMRAAYAQSQLTPSTQAISTALAKALAFFSIPFESRKKIIRVSFTFTLSTFATIVFFGLGGLMTRSIIGLPITTQIGMVFAWLALFMGSIFFLYSLKYYLTLAIVLSYSQQEDDVAGKESFGSLLSKILGNGKGGNGNARVKEAAGLKTDLSNITLKRHPYLSIHIPFYNEKYVVERAMKAATNFDYEGEYEVILCDDSTDETSTIIRNYQKKCLAGGQKLKVISNKEEGWELASVEVRPGVILKHLHRTSRSGFKGGALKLALTLVHPKTEFISVFDADFVPYPDTLHLFLKYFKTQNNMSENYKKTNVAAVQGYQWHVLNKSENWITRGVRSEYAGSYVIERSGEEIYQGLKQISGSVYMIRKDVLEEVGWATSITEDFELTLKLYNKGYKVVYTPYIQAPAECVSTLKRLIKQRMRWAEGHSNNIKKMFLKLLFGHFETGELGKGKKFVASPLTFTEKLEFLYLSPYYLQAFFFLAGTISWLISETVFPARLPFWTSLWGWSLVLTNMISLPLMNAVGLFLEESEERDYFGLTSFMALSYILVPFQAYASLKGFLEKEEGPWFRTPKTGRITDVFKRGSFYRFISGILPGRRVSDVQAVSSEGVQMQANNFYSDISDINSYVALNTANNKFSTFKIKPKKARWVGRVTFALVLAVSLLLGSFFPYISMEQSTIEDKRIISQEEGQAPIVEGIELTAPKESFNYGELPTFELVIDEEKVKAGRTGLGAFEVRAEESTQVQAVVFYNNKQVDIKPEVVEKENGGYGISLNPGDLTKPGKYTLQTTVLSDGAVYQGSRDFTWGVLAINTNKSIYLPGDTAKFAIAVLDDRGEMVCDAELVLRIWGVGSGEEAGGQELENENASGMVADDSPGVKREKIILSTKDGSIKVNPECRSKKYTEVPDYEAEFVADELGIYEFELVASIPNGERLIAGKFEVRDSVAFDIERSAPTRIYPPLDYPVRLKIKVNEEFQGQVVERVPDSFEVLSVRHSALDAESIQISGEVVDVDSRFRGNDSGTRGNESGAGGNERGTKEIVWEVDWKKGGTYELSYEFEAPNISPEFYTLGPLALGFGAQGIESGAVFAEQRAWQIAVDAVRDADNIEYYKQAQKSDWNAVDNGTATDQTSCFTDNATNTTCIRLAKQKEVIRIEFDSGLDSLTAGDTVTVNIKKLRNAGDLLLIPYSSTTGVTTTNMIVIASTNLVKGNNTFTLTTNFINDLFDQGGGAFAMRVTAVTTSHSEMVDRAELTEIDTNLTTFEQSGYRLYSNTDSVTAGTPLAANNTAYTLTSANEEFRLRALIHVDGQTQSASAKNWKLQYAAKSGTCDTAFTGETYADVGTTTNIKWNDNVTPTDGSNLGSRADDPTHGADTVVDQTYEEANNFTNSTAAIATGQDGNWDFSLKDNVGDGTSYCFRIVMSNGNEMVTYSVIPEVTTVPENGWILFGSLPVLWLVMKRKKKMAIATRV